MRKLFFTFLIAGCGLTFVSPAMSQTSQQPSQPTDLDPGQCGAGGMGCTPDDVQKWMDKGNELANLSSADLSQYAYACAKHPDWKDDCETNPGKVLRRLGITDYQ
ncbi:hypothetical protein [Mesorhizobium sp. GR13]|uniref:hypothetical protein n=1 Tax=Mesorhizobium sp. GR13 TaxID=2562308 RepID=UPI001FEF2C82|nr:hypothetical protein [Mesorhizobium sp. GR13]